MTNTLETPIVAIGDIEKNFGRPNKYRDLIGPALSDKLITTLASGHGNTEAFQAGVEYGKILNEMAYRDIEKSPRIAKVYKRRSWGE